jgi:GH15 family glucan-1,4-alpha-glucosidase
MTNPIHDRLIARSIEIIRDGQAATGAYLAAPTFPTYQYSWFRDGAFIADAMSRVGEVESAEAFFGWADRILTDRRDRIDDMVRRGERDVEDVALTEHLHTRYTVEGEESGTDWQDFQLDGYGTWLWALDAHSRRHGRSRDRFIEGARLTVRYLCVFWARPCYDWWEENGDHRHPSSLAAVRAGLLAAAGWPELEPELRERASDAAAAIFELVSHEGVVDGHLTKLLGSEDVDGSLVSCVTPFGLYPPGHPVAVATIERVERDLASGGVHRFLADTYYGGGQWVILAAFLGWHHAVTGQRERALELADWIAEQADAALNLPEQVAADALHPDRIAEWVDRWGESASPLLWSHAMYLTLVTELWPAPVREHR